MGVINLTPDSFSDGGDLDSIEKVLDQVNNFLSNGVDVIDIVIIVDYILNSHDGELECADINDDGDINVFDVVQLVSLILN